jgi:methyl-accepting chemotaxis protein
MRELADGSRQATGRVRTMLLDIARSAESSRLAAESGHDRSDAAVERTRAAAQAIERLAVTLASFVQAAGRIAASATEQANAIQSISAGMSEVRAEAEGAALRVAALEAASHDVLRRAERLQAVIDGYQRGPEASHTPAERAARGAGGRERRGFTTSPGVLEGRLSAEEP